VSLCDIAAAAVGVFFANADGPGGFAAAYFHKSLASSPASSSSSSGYGPVRGHHDDASSGYGPIRGSGHPPARAGPYSHYPPAHAPPPPHQHYSSQPPPQHSYYPHVSQAPPPPPPAAAPSPYGYGYPPHDPAAAEAEAYYAQYHAAYAAHYAASAAAAGAGAANPYGNAVEAERPKTSRPFVQRPGDCMLRFLFRGQHTDRKHVSVYFVT
jgi:hypothetical protein